MCSYQHIVILTHFALFAGTDTRWLWEGWLKEMNKWILSDNMFSAVKSKVNSICSLLFVNTKFKLGPSSQLNAPEVS